MGNSLIQAVVLSISDTRTDANDVSGDRLVELLEEHGATVLEKQIVSDDFDNLRHTLFSITETDANLVLTTGGTGLSERDNTPEATDAVIEKEVPGISEAMRAETLQFTRFAMISRGISGIRNKTLIINLPGSTKGVEQCFDVIKGILKHAVEVVSGPVNHDE